MGRAAGYLGLALMVLGVLAIGVVSLLVVDFDDEEAAVTTSTLAPTTTLPAGTSTTAPGLGPSTTARGLGGTTTTAGGLAGATTTTASVTPTTRAGVTTTSAARRTTTTLGSGLAAPGVGSAGDTSGGTPATGADALFLGGGGLVSLALGARLRRYTRDRSEAIGRP